MSCGLVTGRLQTSIRSELTACLSAIRFAVHHTQNFRIWTNSSFAVKRLKVAFDKQGIPFDNQVNNHDLLSDISAAIWEARSLFLGVYKIFSHQEDQLDEAEQWVCKGNDFVGLVARHAYAAYPTLLTVWSNLTTEISFLKDAKKWVHKVHVETGKMAMHMQTKQKTSMKEPWFNDDLQTEPHYRAWFFQRPFHTIYPHSKYMTGRGSIPGSGRCIRRAICTVCHGFNLRRISVSKNLGLALGTIIKQECGSQLHADHHHHFLRKLDGCRTFD